MKTIAVTCSEFGVIINVDLVLPKTKRKLFFRMRKYKLHAAFFQNRKRFDVVNRKFNIVSKKFFNQMAGN